jgi:hypothetical protein
VYVCAQLDPRPRRNNQLLCSNLTEKFFLRILIKCGITFEFKCLGKFKLIFENNSRVLLQTKKTEIVDNVIVT